MNIKPTSNIPRKRQKIGMVLGTTISLFLFSILVHPNNQWFHSPGQLNAGHEKLKCDYCHIHSKGTLRQKIQANVQYFLGYRKASVPLGHHPVDNNQCLNCHDRPNDRHPVFRFFEPRFKQARARTKAHSCIGCHQEHSGIRVNSSIVFCQHCHNKISIKKDPLQTSHRQLAKDNKWESCLGCHDYHGNHKMKTRHDLSEMLSKSLIQQYFSGSKSPYSSRKYYYGKKEL